MNNNAVQESRVSKIAPKDDPIDGCQVRFGELLAYLYNGEWIADYCGGWRRHMDEPKQPIYVRFKSDSSLFGEIDVPLTAVRYLRDERDAEIDRLNQKIKELQNA